MRGPGEYLIFVKYQGKNARGEGRFVVITSSKKKRGKRRPGEMIGSDDAKK